ncbi:MAG: site-specific integrase, partial [Thermoplasmatales archaeon]
MNESSSKSILQLKINSSQQSYSPSAVRTGEAVKYCHGDTNPALDSAGGDRREKDGLTSNESCINFEQTVLPLEWGARMVNNLNETGTINLEVKKAWKNPYLIGLETIDTHEQLFERFLYIWEKKLRKKRSTGKNYVNDLRRMVSDATIPCNLLKPNPAQIIAYLDYNEDSEHPYKTIDPWKAVTALYRVCGIDTGVWGYVPPVAPPPKIKIIPLPHQVKQLTGYRYTGNKNTTQIIQKILFLGFLLGLRPQEIPLIKIEDVYLDYGYLIITEPKKYNQKRQIFLEKDALVNDRRKSIKNQIKLHDRINRENPYLFITPTGNKWTTDYLRIWLCKYVKPLFPEFSVKTMRTWCAIARLIQTKVETGSFDVYHVKEWLGHDRIKTTESYIRYAEKYYRLAPYDWIRVLLKSP